MATIKNWVASQVKRGESLRNIYGMAKEAGRTKWEILIVILWWLFYKSKHGLLSVGNFLYATTRVITGISFVLVLWAVTLPVFGLLMLLSPLWYVAMVKFFPKKAAYLPTTELEQPKKGLWRGIWYLGFQAVSNVFCATLGKVWSWIWKYQPMAKRQYYLDVAGEELCELSVDEQIEYYKLNPSSATVRKMVWEAVEELRLWCVAASDSRNITADIKNIGDAYELYKELGKTMFEGDEEMFKLLEGYCGNEKRKVTSEFIGFLVEKLLNGEGKAFSRASTLLLLCCEHRTLADYQLKMLAAALGKEEPIGNEAMLMLERYFSRHSFTDNVVRQIVMFATDKVADNCKAKNFELLCKIVRRDGLNTELAEAFFEDCDIVQNQQMTSILKTRIDCEKVSCSYENDENRASWQQYCKLCKDIMSDAQVQMREWQYDVYRACGHKLDKEVIYELLVKRLSEKEKSYFEKVLEEEESRETLNDNAIKLIMMSPWKRDIILNRLEAHEKLEGVVI